MNAVEIEEAVSLLVEKPFDAENFTYEFLEAFGNKATTIKRLKAGDTNKSDINGGVLQRNHIHIAVCDEGKVADTLNQLKNSPETKKGKAKFILATDGMELQAEDLNSGETLVCEYPQIADHFGFFLALAGISTVKQIRENSFDIKATSRLNKLYIELLAHNPEWATMERRHDMNHFLARLIFCFFAEDTGIFSEEGLFTQTVDQLSQGNPQITHEVISEIFRAMDTKGVDREAKSIKNWATKFPYVNGELFSGATDCPKFSKIARSYLVHVGNLDWTKINPDIFGSMIQAVADDEERGELGMHYTSVPNILKVIKPLFLDDLDAQLKSAGDNPRKLLNLRKRMARIRVFDPACGSGNFLVIAYKEMRAIEAEINRRRGEDSRKSDIPLTNFRGIELRDFSAEIARLALIIAEYQCDVLYRGKQLALADFLPLSHENWITCANALRIDWLSICPPTGTGVKLRSDDLFDTPLEQSEIDFENEGGETYICGNPPYKGTKNQTKSSKEELKDIFSPYTKRSGSLDYVAGWFLKAAQYMKNVDAEIGFVSTNSICQGSQVPVLWPILYDLEIDISFARTSFIWKNLASKNAGVTVIIVGLTKRKSTQKRLFISNGKSGYIEISPSVIGPYLVPEAKTIIERRAKPLSNLDMMSLGNAPYDGGNLILDEQEYENIKLSSQEKKKWLRPLWGSSEVIKGINRYCLWIEEQDIDKSLKLEPIRERINAVKKFRIASSDSGTRSMANRPHQFREMYYAKENVLIVPIRSSESRYYLPADLYENDARATNLTYAIYDGSIINLSIITSRIHLVWISTVCGRLKTDFSYSNKMGWNTFPLPALTEKNKADLTKAAEDILIARERHFPKTIADLYEVKDGESQMPDDLRHAHERNDEILERIYIGRRFKNDTERLEKLFELYSQMVSKPKALR